MIYQKSLLSDERRVITIQEFITGVRTGAAFSEDFSKFIKGLRSITGAIKTLQDGHPDLLKAEAGKKTIKTQKLPAVLLSLDLDPKDRKIKHSCLFQIDIDHVAPEVDAFYRKTLQSCPYISAIFTSPSGDGIKAIFRADPSFLLADPTAPTDKELSLAHSLTYKAICNYLSKLDRGLAKALDSAVSDLTRKMLLSHDPDAFYDESRQDVLDPTHYVPEARKPSKTLSDGEFSVEGFKARFTGIIQKLEDAVSGGLATARVDQGIAYWYLLEWAPENARKALEEQCRPHIHKALRGMGGVDRDFDTRQRDFFWAFRAADGGNFSPTDSSADHPLVAERKHAAQVPAEELFYQEETPLTAFIDDISPGFKVGVYSTGAGKSTAIINKVQELVQGDDCRVLVLCQDKASIDFLVETLADRGVEAGACHSQQYTPEKGVRVAITHYHMLKHKGLSARHTPTLKWALEAETLYTFCDELDGGVQTLSRSLTLKTRSEIKFANSPKERAVPVPSGRCPSRFTSSFRCHHCIHAKCLHDFVSSGGAELAGVPQQEFVVDEGAVTRQFASPLHLRALTAVSEPELILTKPTIKMMRQEFTGRPFFSVVPEAEFSYEPLAAEELHTLQDDFDKMLRRCSVVYTLSPAAESVRDRAMKAYDKGVQKLAKKGKMAPKGMEAVRAGDPGFVFPYYACGLTELHFFDSAAFEAVIAHSKASWGFTATLLRDPRALLEKVIPNIRYFTYPSRWTPIDRTLVIGGYYAVDRFWERAFCSSMVGSLWFRPYSPITLEFKKKAHAQNAPVVLHNKGELFSSHKHQDSRPSKNVFASYAGSVLSRGWNAPEFSTVVTSFSSYKPISSYSYAKKGHRGEQDLSISRYEAAETGLIQQLGRILRKFPKAVEDALRARRELNLMGGEYRKVLIVTEAMNEEGECLVDALTDRVMTRTASLSTFAYKATFAKDLAEALGKERYEDAVAWLRNAFLEYKGDIDQEAVDTLTQKAARKFMPLEVFEQAYTAAPSVLKELYSAAEWDKGYTASLLSTCETKLLQGKSNWVRTALKKGRKRMQLALLQDGSALERFESINEQLDLDAPYRVKLKELFEDPAFMALSKSERKGACNWYRIRPKIVCKHLRNAFEELFNTPPQKNPPELTLEGL